MITRKRKLYSSLFIVMSFLFNCNYVFGQPPSTGNWLIYFGNQKISKKWNLWSEVQYRNYNVVGDIEQLLLRTGIGYNLSEDNNNLLLGYGFIQSHKYDNISWNKTKTDEHRIYQQFLTKQKFNSFIIQHRYRIEERILANDFKLRFRYFLSVNKLINKKEFIKNAIYFSAYNEIFLNDRKTIFDRNRLYGGLGYCLNKNIKIELGYMSQLYEDGNRNQFQIILFNNTAFNSN
jgi:hypothetical protein